MNLGIESSPSATVVGLIETDALYGQFPYPVVHSGTNKKTTVTAARGGHDFPRPAPDIGNRAWLAAVLLVLLAGGYYFRGFFFKTQDLTGRVFQYGRDVLSPATDVIPSKRARYRSDGASELNVAVFTLLPLQTASHV